MHTLSISDMLTITVLANDIIYDNLYYVNIFQNTHLTAYGETHLYAPPKVFIQSSINFTQLLESRTRDSCGKEIGKQNIKGQKQTNTTRIHITRIMRYTHRWWYINGRIRPPPKYNTKVPITYIPCNISYKVI